MLKSSRCEGSSIHTMLPPEAFTGASLLVCLSTLGDPLAGLRRVCSCPATHIWQPKWFRLLNHHGLFPPKFVLLPGAAQATRDRVVSKRATALTIIPHGRQGTCFYSHLTVESNCLPEVEPERAFMFLAHLCKLTETCRSGIRKK